jgi:Family of unknown function (DUF6054)
MYSKKYEIEGADAVLDITAFVRSYYLDAYESKYPNGFIRVYEDYGFLAGNDLMVCIRVDVSNAAEKIILVEFIAGGGSSGFFIKWSAGSESRRVKKFTRDIVDFCKERALKIAVIEQKI